MIVYAVICRSQDAAILCEFSSEALTGNAPQVTASLLEHLRDHPAVVKEGDLKTFRHANQGDGEDFFSQFLQACTVAISTTDEEDPGSVEEHFFHLWHQDGVFYCCLSDDVDPREQKVNFAFLQALSHDFGARYNKRRIKNANSYAMDKEFKPVIRSTMHHYNINRTELSRDARINELLTKVEDLKSVLGRNLELLLHREDQLDTLMVKSEKARRDSMVFKKQSNKAMKYTRMKSFKMCFLIFFGLALLLFVALFSVCGMGFEYCRVSGTSNSNGSSNGESTGGG